MADYKKMADSLVSKAKELAESEAVTGAVEKVKNAAGTGISGIFEKGTQRAKNFGTVTKATMDLNRDHKELERVFCEIGKLYYEQNSAVPEGSFAPLFEQIELLYSSIASKEAEINAYKAMFEQSSTSSSRTGPGWELDERIDDFESIVSQTETEGQR